MHGMVSRAGATHRAKRDDRHILRRRTNVRASTDFPHPHTDELLDETLGEQLVDRELQRCHRAGGSPMPAPWPWAWRTTLAGADR
jgi:hypothetical protein